MSEPWFSRIRARTKTVEGRLNKGKFTEMRVGTVVVVSKTASTSHSRSPKVVAVVTKVVRYATFDQYLSQEGLAATLPGVPTIDQGVAVYRQFYAPALEKQHGIVAIHLEVLS